MFADDMTVYVESPEEMTKNTETIKDYSKVAQYKVNIQNSIAFLYIKNKQMELTIKNTMSWTLEFPKIRYLGINPTGIQDLCKKSYETLIKETKEEWKDIPYSWIGLNIVKM